MVQMDFKVLVGGLPFFRDQISKF